MIRWLFDNSSGLSNAVLVLWRATLRRCHLVVWWRATLRRCHVSVLPVLIGTNRGTLPFGVLVEGNAPSLPRQLHIALKSLTKKGLICMLFGVLSACATI